MYLFSSIVSRFENLYRCLDPIQACPYVPEHCGAPRQFYPLLVFILFTVGYGTFGLPYYECQPPMLHQVVDESIWSIIDGTLPVTTSIATLIIIMAMVRPQTIVASNVTTRMFTSQKLVYIGQRRLARDESNKINLARAAFKGIHSYTMLIYYSGSFIYTYYHLLSQSFFSHSLQSYLFWFVCFPIYIFYLLYLLYSRLLYEMLVSMIIQLRQRTIHTQMNELIRRRLKSGICWNRYLRINADIAHICFVTHHYVRQCSPYLSIALPFYVCTAKPLMQYIFFSFLILCLPSRCMHNA